MPPPVVKSKSPVTLAFWVLRVIHPLSVSPVLASAWPCGSRVIAVLALSVFWVPKVVLVCSEVSSRNYRSTKFSQDDDVGVKCKWNRGCLTRSSLADLRRPRAVRPYGSGRRGGRRL